MTPPQQPEQVIVVKRGDDIRLVTEGDLAQRTCVYIAASYNGKIVITGGASIIESIEGKGMLEKIDSNDRDNTEQCITCKHGTRACMFHGYPKSEIPKSCSYKLGVDSEETMRNLTGTHIDCWTKDHDDTVTHAATTTMLTDLAAFLDNADNISDSGNAMKFVSLPKLFKWMMERGWTP